MPALGLGVADVVPLATCELLVAECETVVAGFELLVAGFAVASMAAERTVMMDVKCMLSLVV